MGGMKNGVWNTSEQELRRSIKMMKDTKATDDSRIVNGVWRARCPESEDCVE